jgi:hypothetical protein
LIIGKISIILLPPIHIDPQTIFDYRQNIHKPTPTWAMLSRLSPSRHPEERASCSLPSFLPLF